MATLKKSMTFQQGQLFVKYTKVMTVPFVAARPQVVPTTIKLYIAIAWYTLLYNVQLEVHQQQADWIVLQCVCIFLNGRRSYRARS